MVCTGTMYYTWYVCYSGENYVYNTDPDSDKCFVFQGTQILLHRRKTKDEFVLKIYFINFNFIIAYQHKQTQVYIIEFIEINKQ